MYKRQSYSGDREYEKENTVNFEQHIYLPTNAGVGSTAITDPTKIHHMAFHFSVSPAEYKVVYDGNGGSSVPAGLNCKYDETCLLYTSSHLFLILVKGLHSVLFLHIRSTGAYFGKYSGI